MSKLSFSAVLFDLDGTLVDTAPDLARALNTLRAERSQPPLPLQNVREVTSYGSPGLLKLAFDINADHQDYPQLQKEFIALYEAEICAESRTFEGIDEVLQTLQKTQIPWGVVTNKTQHLAQKLLTRLNLLSDCACLIGGDTTPNPKPAPDPLYAACQRINRKPENCVFIGDSPVDIAAARAAQMPNIAALYGYIPKESNPQSWGADLLIQNPIDLLAYI